MGDPRDSLAEAFDAYAPRQVAARVESAGVGKAALPALQTLTLAVLAGAFISFGACYFLLVTTDSGLGFGPARMLGGLVFSLGLVLVVVAGAELFTGNNLIVMAWADGKVTSAGLLRNWGLVYAGNFAGALGTALLAWMAGLPDLGGVGDTAAAVAAAKVARPTMELLFSGILCNVLVCLAVWMCAAAHTVTGKILAILLPISGFVALGFEHCVANMFLIPFGALADPNGAAAAAGIAGFAHNLIPVTIGNVIGGGVLVALVYWIVYLRRI